MVNNSIQSKRTLSAVMFAELSNISNEILRDDAKFTRILSKFNSIVKSSSSKFSGKIVKRFNTGTLVEFPDAPSCVLCAIDIQQKLGNYNESAIDSDWILSRIGLNYNHDGQAKIDIYGRHIDIAVAIKDLAPLGGFCITQDIADRVKSKLDLDLKYIGPGNIKDLPADIELYTAQPSSDWYSRNVDRLRGEIAEIEKNKASRKFQKSAAANLDEVCEELIFEDDDDDDFVEITPIDDISSKSKPIEPEILDDSDIIEDDELIFDDDDEIIESQSQASDELIFEDDDDIIEPDDDIISESELSEVSDAPVAKNAQITQAQSSSIQTAGTTPASQGQPNVAPGQSWAPSQQFTNSPAGVVNNSSPWGKNCDPTPSAGTSVAPTPAWSANAQNPQTFSNQNLPGSVPPNPLGPMYNTHQVQAAKAQEKHNETHFLRTLITIFLLGLGVYFAYPYVINITDNSSKLQNKNNTNAAAINSGANQNNTGNANINTNSPTTLGLNPKTSLITEVSALKENWANILFFANPKKRTLAGKWRLTTKLEPTEIPASGAIIAVPAKMYNNYQAKFFVKLTGDASIIFPVRYRKCALSFHGSDFSFTGINNHIITGKNPVDLSKKPVEIIITVIAKDGENATVQIQAADKIIFAYSANPNDFTTSVELKLLKLTSTKCFYIRSKTTNFMVTDMSLRNFVRKGNKLEAIPKKK